MSVELNKIVHSWLSKHKIGILAGTITNWRKCKSCGKHISKGEDIISVHCFGEVPTSLCPKCAIIIADQLVICKRKLKDDFK